MSKGLRSWTGVWTYLLVFVMGCGGTLLLRKPVARLQTNEASARTTDRPAPRELGAEDFLKHYTQKSVAASTSKSSVIERAFRSGTMDARAAREALLAEVPPSVAVDPEKARLQVDHDLLQTDPRRALPLLADLAPAKRYELAQGAFSYNPNRFTPQEIYEVQEAISADAPPPEASSFSMALEPQTMWQDVCLAHDSDAFRQWVISLPAGRNRDLALIALANSAARYDPRAAGELRMKISDPSFWK